MGRKRKVTTVEELPDEEARPVEVSPLDYGAESDPLEDAFEEIVGGASSFTVFRLPAVGQQGRRTFCATYRADDLAGQGILEFVAERWGGGRYLISPRGDGGSILKNQTVEIDRSVKAKADLPEPARDTSKSEMIELVREVLRERGAGGGNSPDITAAMIQSAGATAAAMMGMMQPLIAQMAANAKPERPPWEMLTPMLTAALELGAEARGGGGGDGPASYLPLIEKFAGMLEKAQSHGVVPGEPKPAAQISKKAEAPPMAAHPSEPGWVRGLRPYLPYVLEKAKADVPPEFFVGELEQTAPRIVDWLATRDPETWPGELAGFVPELQPFTGWVKRLLEAIGEDDEQTQGDEQGGTESGGV